jgi:uncharacterized protein (DUF1330 family)
MNALPTPAQLAALQSGDPTERIALVRLHRVADRGAYARWLAEQAAAVRAAGGRRSHHAAVEAVLTEPGLFFDELIVDEFPSRELAVESLRLASLHGERALADAVVLAARPRALPRLWLVAAKAWLRLRHGRRAKQPGGLPPDSGHRAIDPAPEEVGAFLAKEPDRPLLVLNLNRHRDRAEYARYGRNTLPHLLRRGDGPVFVAGAGPTVVGAESHPLAGPWDEILLVRYESRGAMLDMLRDPEYQRGLPYRERGLVRAGLVAACPLPPPAGHSGRGASRFLAGSPAGETS